MRDWLRLSTVSDSSPLIALHSIGRLDLLRILYDGLIVPTAVAAEILTFQLPDWIDVRQPDTSTCGFDRQLGPGETEAIALAVQLRPDRLLIDDGAARIAAKALGLPVTGVLGVLLRAKSIGELPAIRPELDRLKVVRFHTSAPKSSDATWATSARCSANVPGPASVADVPTN